jgi:hypothetical protein
MPVTSAPSLGDEQSYAFALNSENILTIYSEADGVGGVQNKSIKVIGDISSSGYISGSHIGDGNGLTNINPSNINIETLTIGDGLFGVSYNGTSAVTISVNSASVHHGDLQGLVDDDHNQYALLNGRNNDILNIDQIKAFDDTGLKLTDTANNGIMIENGGNITGSGDLHLEGNITASGVHFSSMVVDTYIQTPEIRGDGTSITFTDNIIPESDNSLDIGSVSNR